MIYKERTPVKCSCSLRSLVGFDISEAQAMTLVGVPVIDRRSNNNDGAVIGTINGICYDNDIVYLTLYSYWLPEIFTDENRKFQSFSSVSFEIDKFEVEEKFPAFFRKKQFGGTEMLTGGDITEQNKSDYEVYLSLLQNAKIKHVTTKGDFPESSDDNLYIAIYASFSDSTIIVHQFMESGKLCDIYIADACKTLEEFLNYKSE